jgi:hypothetical protein
VEYIRTEGDGKPIRAWVGRWSVEIPIVQMCSLPSSYPPVSSR